jgi:hypothetical protein
MLLRVTLAVFILFFAAHPAAATSITITYMFTGSPGNQTSEAADTQPADATASAIMRGSGITAVLGANSLNSSAWTQTATRGLNDYYEWSVTPDAGFEMDLAGLTFTTRRSATGPTSLALYTSLDGYAAPVDTSFLASTDNTRLAFALGFSDLTSTLTFRLYGFGASSGAGTFRLGIDGTSSLENNLQLTGDLSASAVPEPTSTLSLLAFTLAGLFGGDRYRRRRQRR